MINKNNFSLADTHSRSLSVILSLWVYIYAFFYFIPLIIPSNTLLMYAFLLIMAVLVVMNTVKLRTGLILFVGAYVLLAVINIIVVSYTYYAAVDAFSGLAVFLPALLVISSDNFNLRDFTAVWRKGAILATVVSPVAIALMQSKTIDYGVFTYLNLPNVVIFSYLTSVEKNRKSLRLYYFLAFVNFFIILLFGGRMAALAAAFSIFMGFMISVNIKPWKKFTAVVFISAAIVMLFAYLEEVLNVVNLVLDKFNLSSRSVALLLEQIRSNAVEIYLSGRNVIYEDTIKYILSRYGLPGGFGVNLAISDGKYYHPHNLFLQLTVLVGVIGMILFFVAVITRLVRQKRLCDKDEYNFIVLLLADYILISLSGGSILTNYVAIIGFGMLFFYKKDEVLKPR